LSGEDLATLLQDGWGYHDTQSERLAGELEAAAMPVPAALLARFVFVATHTAGEHLGDWPRARRLAEPALEGHQPDAATALIWGRVSVTQLLAGDPIAATATELACLDAAGDGMTAALIEMRFMLISMLTGCGRAAEAAGLYDAALSLARAAGESAPHRSIAIASNNLASELLEAPARTPEGDRLMRAAAEAAHVHWLKCGDWVNDETALQLRAAVANVLGDPGEAIRLADAGLAIIAANSARPIDTAFLHLARANAWRALGEPAKAQTALGLADQAAEAAPSAALKAWYLDVRGKAPAAA